ncbi:hypothetical protein IFR05_006843 [Cadophora sp. M221]|nr:hypothetical protein IFR05_006843 [Cadophora sp. M221]
MASVGISKLLSSKKSGSQEIMEVKTTLDTLRPVLQQVQLLLLDQAKIDPERAAMIMFEEITSTLTGLVETFSELSKCIEGLETDQGLGWLDSIKWVSRADELKGYWQKLERGKTSLMLMISILTNKSAHAAQLAVAQLRIIVVEGTQDISERMARLERRMVHSGHPQTGNDLESILSQETVRDATVTASTNPTIHPALGYAFDEDLQSSWAYRRAKADATRPFSIASSTQLTQSWSILSGLSLSRISNIAVQALPIFETDIHNSNLYSFGGTEIGGLLTPSPLNPQKHKKNVSESWRAQIRSRLTQSGPKLTLTTQAGSNVETITLPKGLRLLGRNPPASKKTINKADISDPIVYSWPGPRTYECEWLPRVPLVPGSFERTFMSKSSDASKADAHFKVPKIESDNSGAQTSPRLLQVTGEVQSGNPCTKTETEKMSVASYDDSRSKVHSERNNEDKDTWLQQTILESQSTSFNSQGEPEHRPDEPKIRWHIELPSTEPSHPNPFLSEIPLDDEIRDDPAFYAPGSFVKVYNILYLAASLFEFKTTSILIEAGWPYLTYEAGEIFDVIGEKGRLWLAKGHDDPLNKLGWLWSNHFARITMDDRGEEDREEEKPQPQMIHSRDTSTSTGFGF